MASAPIIVLTPEQLRELVREAVRAEVNTIVPAEPPVITRQQAADLLQVDPVTVVKFVREEGLPARKLGTDWRFRRSEVLDWFAKRPQQREPSKRKSKGAKSA